MQNQQRNTLIFISLSFLIVVGSTFVQSWLWPPPPPQPVVKKLPSDAWLGGDFAARVSGAVGTAPTLPGVAGAMQMVTDAHTAEWSVTGRRLAIAARKAEKKPEAPPPPPLVAQKPVQPREEITLGGENFRLTVRLTSRGAGVKNLVLNHFEAADYYGLPTGSRLELIPEKLNEVIPSFVLYHYGAAEDFNPWDTLGNIDWTIEAKETGKEAERQSVTFAADIPNTPFRIRKTFTLAPGDYHLGLAVEMENRATSGEASKFRYQLTGGHGLPIEGVWYTSTFRNALIGQTDTKGGEYRAFQDSRSISHWEGGEPVTKSPELRLQYAGVVVQFFASVVAVDSRQEKRDFLAHARPTVNKLHRHPDKPHLDDVIIRLVSEPVELRPGEKLVHQYVLYNGPVKARLLAQLEGEQAVDPALVEWYTEQLDLRTLADYHMPGWMGEVANSLRWTWLLIKCTNLMHGILWTLHKVVPWYGPCIILLTLLVRGCMFPISKRQAATSLKMQALAPEMKEMQAKYKDDPQGRNTAMMALYRKHGVHPLGSCWILLLQMPIFLGLYYALQESIHFRLAGFLWMKNLAAPDMLIWWSEKIPWLSTPESQLGFFYLGPYFNLLPIIAVSLMLVQQKMLTPPPADEQQEMQQRMMKWMMVVMGVLFYKVAAGLCVYFIVSSLWGMTERQLLPKAKPGAPPPPPEPPASSRGSPKKGTQFKAGKPVRPKLGSKNGSVKPDGEGFFDKIKRMWQEVLEQAKKK